MNELARAYAPVVIFTYKRLHLLRQVIKSLQANRESANTCLIAYSDGPKKESDSQEVSEVRAYLRTLTGFKSVELILRDRNFGLAQSFIRGITETLERYECAIFLEDDNLLSPCFLEFMNDALERFSDDRRVVCVTGYSFPIWPRMPRPYFIRGAETWSMATWRRGWRVFEGDGEELRKKLEAQELQRKVNQIGIDFNGMLRQQIRGDIDSWGVRWWVSAFLNEMYCLYPHEPLCVSIGYGEGSVHCTAYDPLFRSPRELAAQPIKIFPDDVEDSAWTNFLLRLMNMRLAANRIIRAAWRRLSASLSIGIGPDALGGRK